MNVEPDGKIPDPPLRSRPRYASQHNLRRLIRRLLGNPMPGPSRFLRLSGIVIARPRERRRMRHRHRRQRGDPIRLAGSHIPRHDRTAVVAHQMRTFQCRRVTDAQHIRTELRQTIVLTHTSKSSSPTRTVRSSAQPCSSLHAGQIPSRLLDTCMNHCPWNAAGTGPARPDVREPTEGTPHEHRSRRRGRHRRSLRHRLGHRTTRGSGSNRRKTNGYGVAAGQRRRSAPGPRIEVSSRIACGDGLK